MNKKIRSQYSIGDILQALYDSEINASISWFWDGHIDVVLGDPVNGLEATNVETVQQAARWLTKAAIKRYPDSKFTNDAIGRLFDG